MAHTFTPEETRRGGLATTDLQRSRKVERATRANKIDTLLTYTEQGEIGQQALETALHLITHLQQALPDVPISTSLDVARMAQASTELHKLYRLETGQSTSNSLTANVDATELEARKAALLARLQPATE